MVIWGGTEVGVAGERSGLGVSCGLGASAGVFGVVSCVQCGSLHRQCIINTNCFEFLSSRCASSHWHSASFEFCRRFELFFIRVWTSRSTAVCKPRGCAAATTAAAASASSSCCGASTAAAAASASSSCCGASTAAASSRGGSSAWRVGQGGARRSAPCVGLRL
jgi:hypothetical protein